MRIALITDYYLPTLGGVQTAVKAHKEELAALGHDVTVFAPLAAPSDDASIVQLPIAPFAPDGYPLVWPPSKALALLHDEFVARDIDVVHVHSEMMGAVSAYRAAEQLGLPVVQTMHGRVDVYTKSVLPLATLTTIPLAALHRRQLSHDGVAIAGDDPYTNSRLARRMWRLMVSQANHAQQVIVPSHHFAKKLADQGVKTAITVVSNGLEQSVLDRIGHAVVRTRADSEPLRVLWVGRLSPEKRPEVFVDAVAHMSSVQADMYGDGVARIALRRQVERTASHVTVHGGVPQQAVLEAMRDAHVLVSTSLDFDNQPMVILEAIASGLPVIVSDPDLAELLPPDSGAVTATPDAAGLAQTLKAYRDDASLVYQHSLAAIRHRAATAQSVSVGELVRVYANAIAARPKRITRR